MQNKTIQTLGPYTLLQEIGSGTVGTTFRGMQGEKHVALKTVGEIHMLSMENISRVLDKVNSLKNLRHPMIVGFLDVMKESNHLCFVSEWIEGLSLGKVLQRKKLTLFQIGQIGHQIAQGLNHAHRQGVVHGGLHPNNVLLVNGRTNSPQIKLTDFLLASLLPGDPPTNLLPYLAPEQVATRRTNARADIFALGVILYQLVTGRPPFTPQSTAEAANTASEPISAQTLRPDLPLAFATLIGKAAARPIQNRYRSMEEVLMAFQPLLNQLPDTMPENDSAPTPNPILPPPLRGEPVQERSAKPEQSEAIRITHPDNPPKQFALGDKWLITIGSMPGNDLVLPGDGVADKHARLERRSDGSWIIVDMGSRRGTYLDQSRLLTDVPQVWPSDLEVQIGPYNLKLGYFSEAAGSPSNYVPPKPAPLSMTPRSLQMRSLVSSVQTAAGQPVNLVVELDNQLAETAVIQLHTAGIPDEWVTVETGEIVLLPKHKAQVPLVIQPPRNHTALAGHHTVDITAATTDIAGEKVSVAVSLLIAPFKQAFVSLVPPTLRHGQAGTVQITNSGNISDKVAVKAMDANELLLFSLPQPEVELNPGDSGPVALTVTTQKGRGWIWHSNLVPFELQVQTGQQTITLPTQVIVPPRIPTLLLGLLLVVLIGAAGFFGRTQFCNSPQASLLVNFGTGYWFRLCQNPAVTEVVPDPAIEPTTAVALQPEVENTATATLPPTSEPTATAVPAREITIGQSVLGKPITAVAFGSGPQAFIFVGGIHAGYGPSSVTLAEAVIEHYQTSPEASANIPAEVTLFIIPNLNPDATLNPGDTQARINANGVNLNRNWPCNFAPGPEFGTEALSEPENQALNSFVETENPVAVIFWNFPVTQANRSVVSPGLCRAGQENVSRELMNTYASASGYQTRQADPNNIFSGDATDSIADLRIPSVFVLLDSATAIDLELHLAAITAVYQMDFPGKTDE